MNISLPPAMSEFVRQSTDRDYGNVSEFFRELVRERIHAEIETDLTYLESTRPGATVGPSEDDLAQVLKLQKKVRKELRERGA